MWELCVNVNDNPVYLQIYINPFTPKGSRIDE